MTAHILTITLQRLFLAGILAMSSITADGQSMQFNLVVKLDSVSPNMMAFLNHIEAKTGKAVVDSVNFVDGEAKFSGYTARRQKAVLYVGQKNNGFDFENAKSRLFVYLESGNILVSGNDLQNAVLSGTQTNVDAQVFADLVKTNRNVQESLYRKFAATNPADTAGINELRREADQFELRKLKAEEDFFYTHLNSPIAMQWLKANINPIQEKTKANAMFSKLGREVKSSVSGMAYAAEIASTKSAEIGSLAPDFFSKTPEGKKVALSDFRGKYVLLDFWASWCTPCREENPNLLKVYQKYLNRNFTVLGYSLDNSRQRWLKAVADDNLPWTQLSDLAFWNSAPSQLYGVRSIPSNFLINPEGKIIARDLTGTALESNLELLIK